MSNFDKLKFDHALNILTTNIPRYVIKFYGTIPKEANKIFIPRPYREIEMTYVTNIIKIAKGWNDLNIESFTDILSKNIDKLKNYGVDTDLLFSLLNKTTFEISEQLEKVKETDEWRDFVKRILDFINSINEPTIIVMKGDDYKILEYMDYAMVLENNNIVIIYWLPKLITTRFITHAIVATSSLNIVLRQEMVNEIPEAYKN